MHQKMTKLCKNDRDILNAYATQRLTDSIHSIEETAAMAGQQKALSVILKGKQKNLLAIKRSIL